MMIINAIGFTNSTEVTAVEHVSRGTVTGECLKVLLDEGCIDVPVDPIVVGDVTQSVDLRGR